MGWDYDALDGDTSFHLTMWWGGRVMTALDAFGVFDWEATPPERPRSLWADRADDDPWPCEGTATAEELAYLSFESVTQGKVPALKMNDNSLWLITAVEAAALADRIDQHACRPVIEELEPEYADTLEAALAQFRDFCRASVVHG